MIKVEHIGSIYGLRELFFYSLTINNYIVEPLYVYSPNKDKEFGKYPHGEWTTTSFSSWFKSVYFTTVSLGDYHEMHMCY